MEITRISISNLLGVVSADIELFTPVTLFAGPNAAGKSSIREAVRAAFMGMPERVLKKKDFGQLVHADHTAGMVAVDLLDGAATFTAPKGDQELRHSFTMDQWEPMQAAMPYCLDPALFGRSTPDERRQMLFTVTGASAKTADIVASMKQRGVTDDVINAVTPMLRSGFPAALKYAEERCRDAKAAWKAITNETYGHKKAEEWAADVPHVDLAALEQLTAKAEALNSKIGAEQQKLGAAEQRWKAWVTYQEQSEADTKLFARLESLQKKLEHDQDELVNWSDRVKVLEGMAGTGPRVGLVHDLARALDDVYNENDNGLKIGADLDARILAVFRQYEAAYGPLDAQADPEAQAKLPEAIKSRDLMQRAVDNTKRDIDLAKAAGARMGQAPERATAETVEGIQQILDGYRNELGEVTARLDVLRKQQHAAQLAEQSTLKAKQQHQIAQAWQAGVDALSPDGIPSEILLRAIGPVNRELAYCCQGFGWGQVVIDGEMGIYANNRPYALLSESERWRADVSIALVLAGLSRLRLVTIDRMDVLETKSRGRFIDALDIMAEEGRFDTALVFGTLKSLPDLSDYPQTKAHWVEGGVITTEQQAVAA